MLCVNGESCETFYFSIEFPTILFTFKKRIANNTQLITTDTYKNQIALVSVNFMHLLPRFLFNSINNDIFGCHGPYKELLSNQPKFTFCGGVEFVWEEIIQNETVAECLDVVLQS